MSKQVYVYGDYLMHHGIKGQEWGVQNGPPYPLNPNVIKRDIENTGKNKAPVGTYKPRHIAKNMTLINDDIKNIAERSDDVYKKTDAYVEEVRNKFYNDDKKTIDAITKLYNMEFPQREEQFKAQREQLQKLFPKIKELDDEIDKINKDQAKLVDDIVGKYGDVKVDYRTYKLGAKEGMPVKEIINERVDVIKNHDWFGGKPSSMLMDTIDSELFDELYYMEHPEDMSWD